MGDSAIKNDSIYKKWDANFLINMIDAHVDALRSLKALKLNWGRNENFPFIPIACLEFSKKLEALKINHYAEEIHRRPSQ